jgi:hypothetical protein
VTSFFNCSKSEIVRKSKLFLPSKDIGNGIRQDVGETDRSDISDDGEESDDGRRSSDGSRKRNRRVKEESEDPECESKSSSLLPQQQPIKCDASQFSVPGETIMVN